MAGPLPQNANAITSGLVERLLKTRTCQPEGGPVAPSGTSFSAVGLALVPHTGAPPLSWSSRPSALLKPPNATGESGGQKAATVPIVCLATLPVFLTSCSVLSVDAAVARQVASACRFFAWCSVLKIDCA